ncbi:thermonuclease family protein [Microbacterium sp. A93]|uniref:thermonuclease family protein n=1 Tax=Microbacterium sp. A93 TaxID=3450716 RepID=UPI003F420048
MRVKVIAGVAAVAVVGSVAGIAVAQSGGPDDRDRATVVRVIDGDTIDAEVNGDVERVRLLNVDTPENKHPEKAVQCLGPEATDFLEDLLAPGDRIELVYDVERTDRYDRTLAGVYKDESLVNADIAEAGLGVAVLYEPNDRFYQEVLDAQARAVEAGEGLHDPQVECTLPALADALPPLEELPAEIPADAAGVAAALAAAAPVIAAGEALGSALDLVASGSHVVLAKAYSASAPEWRKRVDAALPAAVAYQQDLTDRGAELKRAAEKKAAEEKAAAEKKAAEEKAAAEKKAAEEKAAAERKAEAEQRAEAKAEADRKADEARREAARKAEAEVERKAPPERSRQRQQAPAQPSSPPRRQQAPSSGYGTDADFPGYTGPRCYAPGGRSWRPC